MSGSKYNTNKTLQPSNTFTTHLIIPSSHHQNTQPNQTQKETPTYQYANGESSNTNQQDLPSQKLPEFFVYPEGIIEEGVSSCTRSIIGKIITDKSIHVSSIQNGLESIWGAPQGLKVQEIEGKLLQFFMDKEADQDRILLGNPWIFRNSWLIVKPWDRETDLQTLDFNHVPIWIQLWGLPAHCKTKQMGENLGALMGKVEASEFYEYPGKKMIIKIKVSINVQKPLPSGIHVGNPNDGNCWIDYRYEKLPLVCFKCGIVGHKDKLCRNPPMVLGTLAPLGPWIRSTQYGRRKMEAKDKKFYSNPSQNPEFGKYSPPVPIGLLEKLAAMKIQTPKDPDQQQTNQSSPMQMQYQQLSSPIQEKILQFNGTNHRLTSTGTTQTEDKGKKQITPAKRQKMESEKVQYSDSSQMDNSRVGLAQQASPKP
jgi:hypothetical protein